MPWSRVPLARACALLVLLVIPVRMLFGQTPQVVIMAKYRSFDQPSASAVHPDGGGFGVNVGFAVSVGANVVIQLRNPAGITTPLTRDLDGTFGLEREFDSVAALDSAFPNGNYTLTITGGTAASTTTIAFNAAEVAPSGITNFDALQAWPTERAEIVWQPIPGARFDDFANVTIERPDGVEVFSTLDNFDARVTTVAIPPLLFSVPYRGSLNYLRLQFSTVNNGATQLAIGQGFELKFPLLLVAPNPVIIEHPVPQVVALGSRVQFFVAARSTAAGNHTYQWFKDGVPIPGATQSLIELVNLRLTDAGAYSVEVRTERGTVTSEPAALRLAPTLRPTLFVGEPGNAGSVDGIGRAARFYAPTALAIDSAGVIYVTDTANNLIRRISPSGVVTTIAGAAAVTGVTDGPGLSARFSGPRGIALDGSGNIYIADTLNNTIRKITPAGVVSTLAGLAGQSGSQDGVGSSARFSFPTSIAAASDGTLYVADAANHQIRTVSPTGVVSTLAGTAGQRGFVDGTASIARFDTPEGVAVAQNGVVYVADTQNAAVRTIAPAGVVRTSHVTSSPGFQKWSTLAVDGAGFVYAADPNGSVARLSPAGSAVFLAGGGVYTTVAGAAPFVSFAPHAVAIDAVGALYITDRSGHALLKAMIEAGSADPAIALTREPQSHSVASGDSVLLTAAATGPVHFYQWRKDGVLLPGTTGKSLLLRNPSEAASGQYTVRASNPIGTVTSAPAMVRIGATNDVGRLANLSIRSQAGSGAQTLIVGVAIGGAPAPTGKPLLVRGVGPGLFGFGVAPVLADPVLNVFRGEHLVASNDNWGGGSALRDEFSSVGAFALSPNSTDAALGRRYEPSSYTVQVSGHGIATGIALAEVYDGSPGPAEAGSTRLVNMSARTQVGAGSEILIAGFVIGGTTSKTVLIRGVGPGLEPFNVTDRLVDPQLQLFHGNTLIASNDSWAEGDASLVTVFQTVAAFPIQQRDAALMVTLPPGNYTAQLSGRDNGTGIGLVEIYEFP